MRLIEAREGRKWQEDRETFNRVKVVTEKFLDALGPADGACTDGELRKLADAIGKTFVSEFVKKEPAAGAYTGGELDTVADEIGGTYLFDQKNQKKEG